MNPQVGLTPAQAARMLRVTTERIRQLTDTGRLRVIWRDDSGPGRPRVYLSRLDVARELSRRTRRV